MESRGNIYQTLILAAQSHLEEKGYIPEDLDDFAARCSLAADEILAVFPSTSDLREGLIYQAVTLLNDALRDGVIHAASDDPLVQLRAIGHAYLKWAEANPALFRMLVTALNGPIEPDSTLHRYTSSMPTFTIASWPKHRIVG
ncbi:WHG domain-containing protein [Paracoccus sp. SMMA_5_TC]|uniref:TetR-like C-terminal domain-containing protein n=1 Tax=Paracoccus sp. SMMA_5_TC TaxID=2654280 RepID=UPI0021E13591|nr:TetR-like C-terminal domain-containing protein [Paracoccus sp. SMMA_5_TC]UXU80443.1 WHG domain-containing protein [Paracoccus sp. SMMA_5_TC]